MDQQRTRALVVVHRGDRELTRWAVVPDGRPDLEVIDELARVVLAARRAGDRAEVDVFCPTLQELVHLAGLTDTFSV